jgi:membrane protease YdiL (CAAX protease family)
METIVAANQDPHMGTGPDAAKEGELIKWKSVLLFFACYLGGTLAIGLLIGLVISIYSALSGQPPLQMPSGYMMLILDAIVFFIVFASYGRVRKFVMESMNIGVLLSWRTYGYILAGFFLFLISQYVFLVLLNIGDASKQAGELGVDKPHALGWGAFFLMWLSIAVITPLKEEFLFRGLIHRFLEKRYHFWIGLVISSVIFGLLHFDFPVVAIVMGVIFASLYRLTGSLLPSILLHILWNSFGVIAQSLAG